jgi:hypothetical protein
MNDTELIKWLEEHQGVALISDDFGNWAVSGSGFQSLPENPPADVETHFFIAKNEWKPSVREAIEHAAAQ